MGMARTDFESCTPTEFFHAHSAWSKREDQHHRATWEQTRIIALCSLQPHTTKALIPAEIIPLPWDKEQLPTEPQLSPEERKARYEAALERYGLTTQV